MKEATCTYLLKDGYVQMAQQISTIVGLKGYGGKIKQQTPRQNAVEEIWEETGGVPELRTHLETFGGIYIREEWLHPVGLVDFYNGTESEAPFGDPSFRVYFFICEQWLGKAVDTVEMHSHQLFNINCLPFDRMVPGDHLFIPPMLTGVCTTGFVRRKKDFSKILQTDLEECSLESLMF